MGSRPNSGRGRCPPASRKSARTQRREIAARIGVREKDALSILRLLERAGPGRARRAWLAADCEGGAVVWTGVTPDGRLARRARCGRLLALPARPRSARCRRTLWAPAADAPFGSSTAVVGTPRAETPPGDVYE